MPAPIIAPDRPTGNCAGWVHHGEGTRCAGLGAVGRRSDGGLEHAPCCAILLLVSDIVLSPEWAQLDVEALCGTIMVLGASDTGKSTLARYLYQALCHCGVRAAYLDGDVGQSTLGLPTTMTVALGEGSGDERFPPRGARTTYFVGATTPRGHMLPVIAGSYRLQQQALALRARAIVVDTTGLVDRHEGGKALKQWKIEVMAPSVVIGLQRGSELEPVLWPLRRDGRVRVVELPVSPYVVARSREERMARRQEMLAGYFRNAGRHALSLRRLAVYELERLAPGALLALQDAQGFSLSLGAVELIDRLAGTIVVRAQVANLEGVHGLRFGSQRWDLAGQREI